MRFFQRLFALHHCLFGKHRYRPWSYGFRNLTQYECCCCGKLTKWMTPAECKFFEQTENPNWGN